MYNDDEIKNINSNISKDLSVNTSAKKPLLCIIFFIGVIVGLLLFSNICLAVSQVKSLWDKSQLIQKENSFIIDSESVQTYVRKNGNKNIYKSYIKFYKSGDKWRSEIIDADDNYIFISIYDGKALHDYVNIEENAHSGIYKPADLSINTGMILYEQEKREGYIKESLEDIIADYNHMDKVINWYQKRWYNLNAKESPRIVKKTTINNFPCIYIKFSPNKEACVSEDYGIAIYRKDTRDELKIPYSVNIESIQEYYVTAVRNSARDIVHIDMALFDLPNIKPIHEYGKY